MSAAIREHAAPTCFAEVRAIAVRYFRINFVELSDYIQVASAFEGARRRGDGSRPTIAVAGGVVKSKLVHGDLWFVLRFCLATIAHAHVFRTNNMLIRVTADGSIKNEIAAIIDYQTLYEGESTFFFFSPST